MDHADLALVEELKKNPRWANTVCEAFVKICTGFFNPEYVAVVTDRWGQSLTFGDVYCFIRVHAMLSSGAALLTEIEIGEQPHLDKYAAENNQALESLPFPFRGRFWGGNADDDGFVEWSESIDASATLVDGTEKRQSIPPRQAPLEVGHTNGYTTLRHLRLAPSLARWPYHATRITIIHNLEWGISSG